LKFRQAMGWTETIPGNSLHSSRIKESFMRKLVGILTFVFLSVAVALAEEGPVMGPLQHVGKQGKDDHDDKAPIQSGYAVITPATTSGTGLVVFETFGWRRGGDAGTPQAGVLPPDLTTNAVMFVDSNGRLSKDLGLAIVNPNSLNTNVDVTLRSSDGKQLGKKTVTINSHQQTVTFLRQLFTDPASYPRDVTGTVAITSAGTSNLPVSVVGVRFRGDNFSAVPVTNLSGNSGPLPQIGNGGGAGAVLLPQFVFGGGWATELVLANTGTSDMTVRVDLFNGKDGNPLSARLNGQNASSFPSLLIPAGGVLTLAPRDRDRHYDF